MRYLVHLMCAAAIGVDGWTVFAPQGSEGNSFVAELAKEDSASRRGSHVERSDRDRLKLVLRELAEGRVVTPEDKANAALVLDHSPMEFRNGHLAAVSPNDYLLGHYLASSAFDAGLRRAGGLAAATLDR